MSFTAFHCARLSVLPSYASSHTMTYCPADVARNIMPLITQKNTSMMETTSADSAASAVSVAKSARSASHAPHIRGQIFLYVR